MMVGTGRASALGILVRSGDALERLARADTVVFDKTGTLTERFARVTGVASVPGVTDDRVLGLAARGGGRERAPHRRGDLRRGRRRPGLATDVEVLPGAGVVGTVDGHRVAVGRLDGDDHPGVPARRDLDVPGSGRHRGVGHLRRPDDRGHRRGHAHPSPTPAPAIATLHRMGLTTAILSGDGAPAVTDRGRPRSASTAPGAA